MRRRYQLTEREIAAFYDWRANGAAARRALVKAGAPARLIQTSAVKVDVRMLLKQTVVGGGVSETASVFLARPGHHRLPQQPPNGRVPPVPGGLGAAIGFGAGVLSTCVGALLGARDAPVIGLVPMGGTVAAVAAVTTFAGAVAAAVQCWGLWDGFLVDGLGQLRVDRGGWQGLVALVGCAAAVCVVAGVIRCWSGSATCRPVRLRWSSTA